MMDVHKARVGVTSFDAELAYEEQGLRLGSESDHSIGNHDVDSHPSARAPDCSAPTTYHLKVRSFHPLFLLRAAFRHPVAWLTQLSYTLKIDYVKNRKYEKKTGFFHFKSRKLEQRICMVESYVAHNNFIKHLLDLTSTEICTLTSKSTQSL